MVAYFHMPLFLFVSGRFTKKQSLNKSIIKIVYLLETYIVFQIFNHFNSDIVECRPISLWFRLPATVSWYLLTLVYYKLLIAVSPAKLLTRHQIIIPALIVLSLLAGFSPLSYDYSTQRTLVYMIFFYLGYCTKDKDFTELFRWLRPWMSFVIIGCFFLFFYFSGLDISKIASCARNYYQIPDYGYMKIMLIRGFVLLSAVVLSLCIMKLTEYLKGLPFITPIGQTTLLIYIYHIFFAKTYQHFNNIMDVPNGVVACIIYSLVTLAIVMLMSRLSFFSWVLNPISKTYRL